MVSQYLSKDTYYKGDNSNVTVGNLNDIKVQKDSRHHVLPAIDALRRAQHHLGFPKIHNPNIIMNKYQTNLNAGPCFKCLAIRFKSFKVMTARKDQGTVTDWRRLRAHDNQMQCEIWVLDQKKNTSGRDSEILLAFLF